MKYKMWPQVKHQASILCYSSKAQPVHDCSRLPGSVAVSLILLLTCGYKEDACTEEDIVCLVVDPAHSDTQPAEHQQAGAEDGEHTGGTNNTCRDTREDGNEINNLLL